MKNINESEAISLFVAIAVIAIVFFGAVGNPFAKQDSVKKTATTTNAVAIADVKNNPDQAAKDLIGATDSNGAVTKLIIQDSKVGVGVAVKAGDTVTVDYVGALQNGTEFDNSKKRGKPFTFKVGAGDVIKGWDEGVVGMKKGGQRILVIPPNKGYGTEANGPIPSNSTLLFMIQLIDIAK